MMFKEKDYLKIFVDVLKIKNIVKKKIHNKEINISLNKFNNWDSMSHVVILTSIEKKFNIKITYSNAKFFNNYLSGLKFLKKKIK